VRNHRNKPKKWVVARYYGMFNKARSDRWVFGDRDSGAYLTKTAWTKIVRHQMVDGFASPDDHGRTDYWVLRRRRRTPPVDKWGLIQLQRQHGRCPLCGRLLLHADHEPQSPQEWEQWIRVVQTAILALHVSSTPTAVVRPHDAPNAQPAIPSGLLEPDAGTTRTSGSEGAPTRQRVGATRPGLRSGVAAAQLQVVRTRAVRPAGQGWAECASLIWPHFEG
jgi:hypothetical protein